VISSSFFFPSLSLLKFNGDLANSAVSMASGLSEVHYAFDAARAKLKLSCFVMIFSMTKALCKIALFFAINGLNSLFFFNLSIFRNKVKGVLYFGMFALQECDLGTPYISPSTNAIFEKVSITNWELYNDFPAFFFTPKTVYASCGVF
jgi:hypothetical protein